MIIAPPFDQYDLPQDFYQLFDVPHLATTPVDDPRHRLIALLRLSPDEFKHRAKRGRGTPWCFVLGPDFIRFWPTPDTKYHVFIRYFAQPKVF